MLVVFATDESVEYVHIGYEFIPGQLSEDLKALLEGANPSKEWDGNEERPQEFYDNLISFEFGWKVVADNDGTYPEKMGTAASAEFRRKA